MAKRSAWMWLLGITALVVGGVYTAYRRSDVAQASDDLENQIALAKKEGICLDLSDLHPKPIPEAENAERAWISALHEYQSAFPKGGVSFSPLKDDPSDVVAARTYVTTLATALQKVREAVKKPHLVYDREYEKGPNLEYFELAPTKGLAKALCVSGELEVRQGREAQAYEDFETAAKLAALFREDPSSMGMFVQSALEGITLRAVQESLTYRLPAASALGKARQVLSAFGPLEDLRTILPYDSADAMALLPWFMRHFDEIQSSDGPMIDPDQGWILKVASVQRANRAHTIEYFRKVYAAIPAGDFDAETVYPRLVTIDDDFDKRSGPGYLLTPSLFSDYVSGQCRSILQTLARRRVTEAGINILEERLRTGKWPDRAVALAKDPLASGSLIYHRTPSGFIVYSVGANGKDEEGALHTDDITFIYPMRPREKPAPVLPRGPD